MVKLVRGPPRGRRKRGESKSQAESFRAGFRDANESIRAGRNMRPYTGKNSRYGYAKGHNAAMREATKKRKV